VKESYKSKPDAIIHVTAHMDSAMASPGASDNASGLAALLELARIYRTVKTGGVEIRFVAVGAEEGGLNGSRAYVDSLTAAEKAISINYNMDMIATSWPDATVVSLDVNPRDTGIFNLPAALIIAGAETLPWIPGTENVRWYQYGSSDHVPFQDAKIDAASMIRATDATDDIEPADHTTGDDMVGNYSRERLWEAANMMSKGISRAIDNKLTLHLEYTVKSSGKVEVTNWENLKFLFDSLKITLQPKDGKEAIFITASSKDKFQFALPVGECTMTALG
ncbi:MAG: M20/M25/M40 family metallo-hydrolase, partial [Anaerovorax sp.]